MFIKEVITQPLVSTTNFYFLFSSIALQMLVIFSPKLDQPKTKRHFLIVIEGRNKVFLTAHGKINLKKSVNTNTYRCSPINIKSLLLKKFLAFPTRKGNKVIWEYYLVYNILCCMDERKKNDGEWFQKYFYFLRYNRKLPSENSLRFKIWFFKKKKNSICYLVNSINKKSSRFCRSWLAHSSKNQNYLTKKKSLQNPVKFSEK